MRNISDLIEQHLKYILQNSPNGTIEIQRNELADQFQCVPSQINYVIGTRFTVEKGYIVESKRGGGGYVRIQKVELPPTDGLKGHLFSLIQDSVDQPTAEGLISRLAEQKFLSEREAQMMKAALSRDTLQLKLPLRDQVRARLFRAMLTALLSK
ncbi:CtsR family transcriptional regulator [Paenibacillus thermoaerophilus]|uniref:Transcriptional regulator CtsR n=1 Tax=Paenibacillus thermoaerophilus TaxID=1215385 RepID=A0ABW2V4Z6_9BACL|nr:CtsR family transcriptional regulator [Paenibacillus thermoaerophilus]TMV11000.1 CtsR family transcriptional regulator [Paenibacillus thermoaerophilus]